MPIDKQPSRIIYYDYNGLSRRNYFVQANILNHAPIEIRTTLISHYLEMFNYIVYQSLLNQIRKYLILNYYLKYSCIDLL